MIFAWYEELIKDDTCILNLFTKLFSFRKHFDTVLINRENYNSEILSLGVCDTETFNDQT